MGFFTATMRPSVNTEGFHKLVSIKRRHHGLAQRPESCAL